MVLRRHFKIVCDLETAGGCPIRHGVISACLLVINEKNEVVDQFVDYVRPPNLSKKWWSFEAQGKHGITYEQVENFKSNEQFCYDLLCFLAPYRGDFPLYFICHASPWGKKTLGPPDIKGKRKPTGGYDIQPWFDYTFLSWCFRQAYFSDGTEMIWKFNQIICAPYLISTVRMGQKAGFKKNPLNIVAERIGFNLKHHDATSDTYCCFEAYKYYEERNDEKNIIGINL